MNQYAARDAFKVFVGAKGAGKTQFWCWLDNILAW